jgi:hypothetical protein
VVRKLVAIGLVSAGRRETSSLSDIIKRKKERIKKERISSSSSRRQKPLFQVSLSRPFCVLFANKAAFGVCFLQQKCVDGVSRNERKNYLFFTQIRLDHQMKKESKISFSRVDHERAVLHRRNEKIVLLFPAFSSV